jgi:general secretion pathway protein D
MGGWAKRSERDPEDDFAPRAYETSAMKRIFCLSLLPGIAAAFVASPASAQIRPRPAIQAAPDPPAAAPTPPPGARPPSATPNPPLPAQNGAPAAAPAAGAPGAPVKSGKPGDTASLPQFEQGVDFEPKNPDYKVAFSLEDADLPEIVRVIGQLTGKRFIFGGKVRNIKATVYSPQKVTVAEAYQAFLSILETNGLTVIPHGRFLKIVETGGVASQTTPTYEAGQGAPNEDRYVTRIHRLGHVSAEEVATVLGHFKTKDGDITVYAPGNLLIITDTGSNIRRMMQIVEDVDVGSAGDQIWIEPIHYASASEIASRVNELFDIKNGTAEKGKSTSVGVGDLHVSKLIPDDRTNSLVIVATERAYMRILEIIKRLDVPQTGEGEIHVLPLQHADAVELTKTLNEIITGAGANTAAGGTPPKAPAGGMAASGIFEAGVKVSADKATNSIVVTSSLRDYASLHAVIERLDLPRRQVFIDAVVLDLDINRTNQLGFNFHAADLLPTSVGGQTGSSLVYGGLNPLTTILLPDPTTLQGMALGVRGPGIPGSENLLGTGLTIPAFGALINAIATSGDTDVLSTPHILATDNEDAEINVGQNIPLQTNSGFSGLSSLGGAAGGAGAAGGLAGLGLLGAGGGGGARTDVGTKIKIKPHLNESNEVRIELTEEISEALNPQGQLGVVPISKRNATTKLIVRDQQTVIIGGLMRNRITHSETKIPILGDIPVLGALFRQTTDGMEKSNLILILTPFIIREQSDLRSIFERKMQERQDFLDRYFIFSDKQDYQPPHDYSRTYGLLEDIRQSYRSIEESKILDEATRPKEVRGHEPGEPLEMPAIHLISAAGGAAPAPEANAEHEKAEKSEKPEGPAGRGPRVAPNLNVTPAPRGVNNVEK